MSVKYGLLKLLSIELLLIFSLLINILLLLELLHAVLLVGIGGGALFVHLLIICLISIFLSFCGALHTTRISCIIAFVLNILVSGASHAIPA